MTEVCEVVRVAGGPGVRTIYALRDGRPLLRAPSGERVRSALAAPSDGTAGRAAGRRELDRARVLAAASGALLVCAAWEGLGALMRLPLLDLMALWTGPARHAGRGGRAPARRRGPPASGRRDRDAGRGRLARRRPRSRGC